MDQGFTRTHEDAESSCQPSFCRSRKPDFSRARFRARARLFPFKNRSHRMGHRPAFWCLGWGTGAGTDYCKKRDMNRQQGEGDSPLRGLSP